MTKPNGSGRTLRIAIVAITAWYLNNFRRNLMRALAEDGHEVVALGGDGEYAQRLRQEGFRHAEVRFSSDGTRPLRELRTVRRLRQALRRERIDLVLSYTPKGNIYAALAMLGTGTSQIMNISGLGRAFVQRGMLGRLVTALYRLTVGRAAWVFFQNDDDWRFFIDSGLVRRDQSSRLPGSGVDLHSFRPAPLPGSESGACSFLMVARLLWDKGVGEYAAAARRVRQTQPQARFQILGPLDDSPRRVPAGSRLRGPAVVLPRGRAALAARGGGNGAAGDHHRRGGLPSGGGRRCDRSAVPAAGHRRFGRPHAANDRAGAARATAAGACRAREDGARVR